MLLIAIDTSATICAVGVANPAKPPVLITRDIGRGHAEALPGLLDQAMAEAGLAWAEIERVAVTVGPGSFTGVRIGIAAARGLGLVIGCPVVGVTTLAVHAEAARKIAGAVPILALMPARGDDLYGQFFAADGTEQTPPEIAPTAAFATQVTDGVRLAGPGAPAAARLVAAGDGLIVHADPAPDIAALLRLGAAARQPETPPKPVYLRPPDAVPPNDAIARQ